ncbi:MAG: hypothetical protein CYPHOPRED_004449 [Cyphobasidiales sp. Tagirdzhanova-0007]|nr:MAG: hypothetical protein CYPHOPRED_004449 [Cyphobasidiales sp. Tagirdzhanova-0007]
MAELRGSVEAISPDDIGQDTSQEGETIDVSVTILLGSYDPPSHQTSRTQQTGTGRAVHEQAFQTGLQQEEGLGIIKCLEAKLDLVADEHQSTVKQYGQLLDDSSANKNEEQERPKKKKGVIEISDDESDRKSDVRSEKRKKASPMADMVEMKRMEIVAHLGRLGMFEEYPYLSFNSFGESISSTLDDASSARSEADLVFLDVQMRFLRTIMMMMEKAEHIIEVKDKLRKVMKNMK